MRLELHLMMLIYNLEELNGANVIAETWLETLPEFSPINWLSKWFILQKAKILV